jgi:polyphosphate kinase
MSLSLKDLTVNRELSWLSFNHRVLQEASDENVPLVERIRFLGIFSNNLDEFFRVRVATMKRIETVSPKKKSLSGERSASEILEEIHEEVLRQKDIFGKVYEKLIKSLEAENIFMVDEKSLSDDQKTFVVEYYREQVAPLLVPIMLKSIAEFPYLRDKSIYLAVKLSVQKPKQKKQYALIEVPSEQTPRFVVLPEQNGRKYIMFLDDVIRFNFDKIFGLFEYSEIEAYNMKITRDAELDIDDDVSKGIYEKVKKSIRQRTKGQPVRFVHDRDMSKDLLKYFRGKLELDVDDNVIAGGRYHNSKDFMKFPNVGRPELEWSKLVQIDHPHLMKSRSILAALEKNDILLHYPYNHFRNFVHYLREAAIHPEVKEIRISLYRVANQSRVVNALISAVKNGKQVTAMVELRARFDEENNLNWARKLQDAGVKVIFGIPDMKVHCKLALVTRVTNGHVTNYAVISTGNFNEATGKVYSDFALFTANQEICDEAQKVFAFIEKPYRNFRFKHLIVAPASMRNQYIRKINQEIRNAKEGKKASIFIKINSIVDETLIRKLYQASKAGVKIRILVRGICSLIPGIPGVSENIEARSIVDRFLEHSRVFVFANDGAKEIYISSADWMTRNLDFRVEVSAAIYDPFVRAQIMDFMELQWNDNSKARIIDQKQKNKYVQPGKGEKRIRAQFDLFDRLKADYKKLE